jgi:hypothetical protein
MGNRAAGKLGLFYAKKTSQTQEEATGSADCPQEETTSVETQAKVQETPD